MLNFTPLDVRTARERIEMVKLWDAWVIADRQWRHDFADSVGRDAPNGREYLHSRKQDPIKSIGFRLSDIKSTHLAYHHVRQANKTRPTVLSDEMDRQAAVLRALNAGRLPIMASRTLRALRPHNKPAAIRVIGSSALYGYEALAGVAFNIMSSATRDVDAIVEDRGRLRLLTDTKDQIGLTRLVQQAVDNSFQPRSTNDFRLINDKGHVIEFVRPDPAPICRTTPVTDPAESGNNRPAPSMGIQWLASAPVVEVVVIDERGYPALMRCLDPRHWAAHKLWLSTRADRDPKKKRRDRLQADVLLRLVARQLPQFPLDQNFRQQLPRDLAGMLD